MHSSLRDYSLFETANILAKKDVSCLELTQAYHDAIASSHPLNAYVTLDVAHSLAMARAADTRFQHAVPLGVLDGIPLGIKDNYCTNAIRTTAASMMLDNFVPSYEATVTQRLWDSGCVLLGKTNMDEFSMGSATTHTIFGATRNPWSCGDSSYPYVAGGSSGGSAAAVAAHLCVAALGTDTGGSVRQPASYTGIVGMKPSYGTCSRYGIIAYASSLDQAGVLARSVSDCALLLHGMAGFDPLDASMGQRSIPDFSAPLSADIRGRRFGVVREAFHDGLATDVRMHFEKTARYLTDAGAELVDISLPSLSLSLPAYYVIALSEMASNLSRFDGVRYGRRSDAVFSSLDDLYRQSRSTFFGQEVLQRIMVGTYVTSVAGYENYFLPAAKVRRLLKNEMDTVFSQVDALLMPTTPTTAFTIDAEATQSPLVTYLNDIYTVPANLTGLPAISVPVGLDSGGMPVGMQILAGFGHDVMALRFAYAIEQAANFIHKPDFLQSALGKGGVS